MNALVSPLLDPATSPLDDRRCAVVQRVSDAERAHILALPSNDPLDPKLRFRVEATGPELFGQPAAIQATLRQNTNTLDGIADRLTRGIRRVVLVGCGDSLAVMIAAPSGRINYFGCESKEVNDLLDEGLRTGDMNTYVKAGDLYGQTGCFLNLSYNQNWVVAQKWLTGVPDSQNIGANELNFSLLGIAK
jgi:hypothetical protein